MFETLIARVVAIESGDDYTDGLARVMLRIDEADSMFNRIRLKVEPANLPELGQQFALLRCTSAQLDVLNEGLAALKGNLEPVTQ